MNMFYNLLGQNMDIRFIVIIFVTPILLGCEAAKHRSGESPGKINDRTIEMCFPTALDGNLSKDGIEVNAYGIKKIKFEKKLRDVYLYIELHGDDSNSKPDIINRRLNHEIVLDCYQKNPSTFSYTNSGTVNLLYSKKVKVLFRFIVYLNKDNRYKENIYEHTISGVFYKNTYPLPK